MRPPAVRGVVVLRLGPALDLDGRTGERAELLAWQVLAGCPAGVAVQIDLADASYLSTKLLEIVAEHTAACSEVEVTGSNKTSVGALVSHLRRSHQEASA